MKTHLRYVIMTCLLLSLSKSTAQNSENVIDTLKKATKELPLEPTRKINFTTDKGTWISVDVSPDGKTIMFDLMGDLYTIPINGGKATRIT
ncbi:hypothetical protein [uncultured Winogradskyella sp.]|uniref:hypothetical protein n=1 Tax=uncultured Winogradskyella sp. TaxID=395353 RepID=UPI0030DD3A5A|tara:strand:- start:103695 stop:103967 length:273 start_codon:yes stop_codon:yes gene_type:complete